MKTTTPQTLAPIALFVYKRPFHTLQTLESLARNPQASNSTLYIFCDGPKSVTDVPLVEEVRKVIRQRSWCGHVQIVEQEKNRGLANSIIQGVTQLVNRFGSVIVLEDDLLLGPYFLNFMNEALLRYQRESRVMNVTGYLFPARIPQDHDACFFPMCSSWGWATWQRAWQHFDPAMNHFELLQEDPFLRHRFDLDGTHPFFSMLQNQRRGHIDSWAIRWYLSCFMQGGLTVFPTKSLVCNIGFDNTGTHCGTSSLFETSLCQERLGRFPEKVGLSQGAYEGLKDYFRRINSPNRKAFSRWKSWMKKLVG